MIKRLLLLGASGNIGEQTLDVIRHKKNDYQLIGFSVGEHTDIVDAVIKEHKEVEAVCFKKEEQAKDFINKYPNIAVYFGDEGLLDIITRHQYDLVVNALVGFVGLHPTLVAIENDINVALANKESLVVGGELVNKALKEHKKVKLFPIDSEHSAIYKCFRATKRRDVSKILITASGGAFRNLSRKELKKVTPEQALHHPTWKMGPKVTIDSASMLNKGFEIIEAYYLFRFNLKKIEVLMHDESYLHSALLLKDGTYLGEVNAPDMRNPIAYALKTHHGASMVKKVSSLEEFGDFHFHEFDPKRYPMVPLALSALRKKGIMPCILNASDEVAVKAFLDGKISFLGIEKLLKDAIHAFSNIKHPSYEELVKYDQMARIWCLNAIKNNGGKY